jgi:hypothetical protein
VQDRQLPFGGDVRKGREALSELKSDAGAVWSKVPTNGALMVALLDPEPFVYRGHFTGGRMRPCPGHDTCALCAMRMGAKARACFGVFELAARRAGVLEVNDSTALEVLAYVDNLGIGRGLVLSFRKEDRRVNGAIRVSCQNQIWRESELPECPDVEYILKTQWTVPQDDRRSVVGNRSW